MVLLYPQLFLQLFKNVAERGRWGELLNEAHSAYWSGRHTQALVTYTLLAELGYEVAQSNAAFILDRHNTHLFPQPQAFARALMYWGRAAAQVTYVCCQQLGLFEAISPSLIGIFPT